MIDLYLTDAKYPRVVNYRLAFNDISISYRHQVS